MYYHDNVAPLCRGPFLCASNCHYMWPLYQFYDAWKGLCDWLDESEKKYKKYTSGVSKVKQDIDELRVSITISHTMSLFG